MSFTWTDRDGRRHDLTKPKPMEDEAEAFAREIDRYLDLAADPDPLMRNPARAATRAAHARLETLHADLVRWNAHADGETRRAAAELAGRIDGLPDTMAAVMLVVALHDEHDQMIRNTAGDPHVLAAQLAEPMTETQGRAIAAIGMRAPPFGSGVRGKVNAWLDTQADFARSGAIDGGWFTWIDRHGHAHRLHNTLMIEREMVAIACELQVLKAGLFNTVAPMALHADVTKASTLWERLRLLQCELDRFVCEATAREDTQWSSYAADWRTKRSTT